MKQSLLLYSKTHTFETREQKLHVLLIAFGSECSRERKYQGAKVPPMVLSLLGRKYVGTKVPVTFYSTFINVFKFFLERFFTSMADSTASRTADSNSDCC